MPDSTSSRLTSVAASAEEFATHDCLVLSTAHEESRDAALYAGVRLVVDTRDVVRAEWGPRVVQGWAAGGACRGQAKRYTRVMAGALTPEQIEVYAATLRARTAETARRRRDRRERAWAVSRQAAQVLRSQFSVAGVWAFGSLVEDDHFTERSDIDLAATGLTPSVHMEALGRLLRLSPEFEFDLVDLDHCPAELHRAIEHSGVEL